MSTVLSRVVVCHPADGLEASQVWDIVCPSSSTVENAQRLTNSLVHRSCTVWVAATKGVGTRACGVRENSLGGQRGEELASAIGGARAAQSGEAVQEDRGQGRVDAHCDLPRSGYSRTRASTGSSAAVAERNQEVRLGPARDPSREKHRSCWHR